MQPHAGRPHSSPPSSSSRFSPTTTDPSRDVGELLDAADDRRFHERRSALTPLFDLRGINQSVGCRRRGDGVEDDAMIQDERAVNLIPTQSSTRTRP